MKLNQLKPAAGSRHKKKRIGRGQGSGFGGTSTKGHKGQNARSGGGVKPGFEGGQMPLQRRLPKRGFNNKSFAAVIAEVNVQDLRSFPAGSLVDAMALAQRGLIKGSFDFIKLLGKGEIENALTIRLDRISAAARAKIEAAGGAVEIVQPEQA
jgi:large subunit ribosomal protein L15